MPPKSTPVRAYHSEFIEIGFHYIEERGGIQKPQCVICYEVLSNESMKKNKLERHFQTKHPAYKGRDKAFFERKLSALRSVKLDKEGDFQCANERALEASYRVSLKIVKAKKTHTIGEDLVLPCALELVSIMLGDEMASKIRNVPLSNNTVCRRIADMSEDVTSQNVDAVRRSPWHAIQLDESTDIDSCAQLIAWFRFIKDDKLVDEPLLCKALESTTKGEDIFGLVESFYRDNNLDFKKLIGSTTDGAPAMLGKQSGFNALLKRVAPNVTTIHCMLHREALAARTMPDSLKSVLSETIKIVNFIKSSAVNTRLFRIFCREMDADHLNLLYHTQVRWLSRGNVLMRVYDIRDELREYLRQKDRGDWVTNLESDDWLGRLCYMSDIFERLNALNCALQGRESNIMIFNDKVSAFIATLTLLEEKAKQQRFTLFPRLASFLKDGANPDILSITNDMAEHLRALKTQFQAYFPDLDVVSFVLARNPFSAEIDAAGDDDRAQEEFVQLKTDTGAKAMFDSIPLNQFWVAMLKSYPTLSSMSLKLLMPYPSTYLCEQSFSTMVVIKTKYRNRLEIENDMILALSEVKPRIKMIMQQKQAHPAH